MKTETKEEREIQWVKKLRKVKISDNSYDWKQVKNVLGLRKDKLIYPDLVGSDGKKKAETDEVKLKLFEKTVKQIFCTDIFHLTIIVICQKKRKKNRDSTAGRPSKGGRGTLLKGSNTVDDLC